MDYKHSFILPCGLNAKVGILKGTHLSMLVRQDAQTNDSILHQVIASVIYSVGSDNIKALNDDEKLNYVRSLRPADYKSIYVNIRQNTFEFPDTISFKVRVAKGELSKEEKQDVNNYEELEFVEDIPNGNFDFTFAKSAFEIGAAAEYAEDNSYEGKTDLSYSDLPPTYTVSMPLTKNGSDVEVTVKYITLGDLLRSNGDVDKMIILRKPTYIPEGKTAPLVLDFSKMRMQYTSNLLRKLTSEGDVHTVSTYLNTYTNQEEILDVIHTAAFLEM